MLYITKITIIAFSTVVKSIKNYKSKYGNLIVNKNVFSIYFNNIFIVIYEKGVTSCKTSYIIILKSNCKYYNCNFYFSSYSLYTTNYLCIFIYRIYNFVLYFY